MENVLRGAGYVWTQDLWIFLKLQEVGFLLTWVLFPFFSTFRCFGWFEAVRDRLIGPKTWDRIDIIFGTKMEQPVTAPRLIWVQNCAFVC